MYIMLSNIYIYMKLRPVTSPSPAPNTPSNGGYLEMTGYAGLLRVRYTCT